MVSSKIDEKKQGKTLINEPDYEVGVQFINDYLNFCNDLQTNTGIVEWIGNRQDVSNEFKSELKRIIKEAESRDPELGLGFDPILDAQDNPDQFEIAHKDSEYLIVKGIDWPDFQLTLKLKLEGENTLVDGSGIINVLTEKRIKR